MAGKFEYRFLKAGSNVESRINQLAKEGWEVVSHAVTASGSEYSVMLKRALR